MDNRKVAPYIGAWIEIFIILNPEDMLQVAPYIGAWIEMAILMLELPNLWRRSLHRSVD